MHEGLTEDVVSIRNLRVVTYVMEGAGVALLGCWVWWVCGAVHRTTPHPPWNRPARHPACM